MVDFGYFQHLLYYLQTVIEIKQYYPQLNTVQERKTDFTHKSI